MEIIKDKKIVSDEWVIYSSETEKPESELPLTGAVIYPFEIWREHKELLKGSACGVLLEPHDHPEEIEDYIETFKVIAINFPTFMDGRGYSYAKILRDRYHYKVN